MLDDQENYDTFEYDKSDGEMYEPLTDTVIIPKNAPPLPPARNKYKPDTQKKPLGLPKFSKDFKSGSLPRNTPIPQVPDCDENYEEFPCLTQDDFTEENYECFDNDVVDNDPPLKVRPPLPDRKYSKEKPKIETKPIVPKFKRPDSTKNKEKPQTSLKPSFMSEINNKIRNIPFPGKESSPAINRKKSIGSDPIVKATKGNSFSSPSIPQQQPQPSKTEQNDTDEEDPREVYADACDVRLFLQNKPWYFGKLGRKAEEGLLNGIKQNGAFLLRDSSQASLTHPFTLTVYSNNHFYRLKIRHLESGKFVVGEKKDSEVEFNTIQELITYYETEPLILLATNDNSNSCTTLKYIPEKPKTPN